MVKVRRSAVERNGRFERCRAVIRPGAVAVCVALAKAINGTLNDNRFDQACRPGSLRWAAQKG